MCLKCLLPGTGTGDAPRAFNLKLGKVTTSSKCGYKPLTLYPQTEVKHEGRRLVGMTAKHVDDIKAGAPRKEIEHYKKCLAEVFGDLDYSEGEFVCTGDHRRRQQDGTIRMDQTEYIKTFKPIAHPELVGTPAEAETTTAVHAVYMSLLGAVACALLTQMWIAVCVVALQRKPRGAPTQMCDD